MGRRGTQDASLVLPQQHLPPESGDRGPGPPGAAVTACRERCRWQQQPAPVVWPQLNLFQMASITGLFLIFLAGLG